jgi:hypothetical protein
MAALNNGPDPTGHAEAHMQDMDSMLLDEF